jgi:hypothetical protein
MLEENYSYWDIGSHDQFLRLSDKNLALLSKGLIESKGKLLGSSILDSGFKNKNMRTWSARIKLPNDKLYLFKEITGFELNELQIITGQDN